MPDLETLLRDGKNYDPTLPSDKDARWLKCVRKLLCVRCKRSAGTAHHIYTGGGGMKCSDYVTVPACITCHVTGQEPLQGMTPERFLEVVGTSMEAAVRRTHVLVKENIRLGIFEYKRGRK